MKKKYKILIVEDSMTAMLYTSNIVNSAGYEVVEAINGKIALEKLLSDSFDMIISDILMPEMDGFQLLKHVKEEPDLRNIPFIFHTATYNSDKDKDFGVKLGVDAYIHKFKDPSELSELIHDLFKELEAGKFYSNKPKIEQQGEVFKLYSERLINKLEKKVLDLEKEINEHKSTKKYAALYDKYKIQNEELIKAKEQAEDSWERLERFMNSATDHFSLFDSELNLIDLNTSSLEKFFPGRKKEELIGKNLHYFSPNLKQSGVWDKYMQVIKTGKPFQKNDFIPHPKFGDMYLSVKTFKVGNGMGMITTDITESKIAEEALRKSEIQKQTLLDGTTDMIIHVDTNLQIIWANKTALTAKPDVVGMICYECYVGREKPCEDCPVVKAIQSGNIESGIMYHAAAESAQGESYWELIGVPMKDGAGNITGAIEIGRNITDRKLGEEALKKNEKRLSLIYNSTSDNMVLMEVENPSTYRIVSFNDEYLRSIRNIYGEVSREQLLNQTIKELKELFGWPDSLYDNTIRNYLKVIETGKPVKIVDELPTLSTTLFFETVYYPVFDNEKICTHILYTSRDITARMKAEEENLKLLTAVTQSPSVITITDLHGNLEYVNPKFTELTGYSFEEAKGENIKILRSHEQSNEIYKELWQEISAGKEWSGEFHNKKKNGELFWESASISPIIDKNGKTINYIKVAEDITERKKAEEELKSALGKAQESDRLKSAFLTNMSHEIRTPMNGILGFTGLLNDPQLTGDKMERYIRIIEKSGDRMLNTINDIIDISKIEAGQVEVVKSEVSLNIILREQYTFFNSEAQLKGLELIYKPTLSDKEAIIVADKHKLEGILTNLIKNAIKFTKNGNISFGYTLKKEKDFEGLEFYVKDTGIGIPSDRLGAIFNRFEQADIEDTRVYEGSGLGLAISKSYVEMLGGKIWVVSEEAIGSTFYFTIPCKTQKPKETITVPTARTNVEKYLENVTMLVAEDDWTSVLLFEEIFNGKFHNIFYTKSGTETIEEIKKNPGIDIILMDIKMPEMDGYTATREIRKFNREVIIIAQTAFGLSGDRKKAIDAGCNDYITKPIIKDRLLEMIWTHIGSSEYHKK